MRRVLAFALLASALALTACAVADEPASMEVRLVGTLTGDDWRAQPSATLTTYSDPAESYLEVTITYAGDGSDNSTPNLTATFDSELGPHACETHRSYIWNSMDLGAPMTLSMRCDFIPDNVFDDVATVTLGA